MKSKLLMLLLVMVTGKLYAQHDLDVVNNLPCLVDVYYNVDDGTTCWTGAGPYGVSGGTTITLVNGWNPGWVYLAEASVGSAISAVYDCTVSCTAAPVGMPACPFMSNTLMGIVPSAGCGTSTATITFTPSTPSTNAVLTIQ